MAATKDGSSKVSEKPPLPQTESRFHKWSKFFHKKDLFWRSSDRKKSQTWTSKDSSNRGKKRLFDQLAKLKQQQQTRGGEEERPKLTTSLEQGYYDDNEDVKDELTNDPNHDVNSNYVGENLRQQKIYKTISSLDKRKCTECHKRAFGSGPDLVEKSVRFSLPKKKKASSSVDNLIDGDDNRQPSKPRPCGHHHLQPEHAHLYCPGSTMSLNRRHFCKHSRDDWCDTEEQMAAEPMMTWESTCLYENTG